MPLLAQHLSQGGGRGGGPLRSGGQLRLLLRGAPRRQVPHQPRVPAQPPCTTPDTPQATGASMCFPTNKATLRLLLVVGVTTRMSQGRQLLTCRA